MIHFPPIRDTSFGRRRRRDDIRHKEIVARLLVEHGPKCHWCQVETTAPPSDGRQHATCRTRDHVLSVAEGGPDTYENSVIACSDCNARRGRETSDKIMHDRLHIIAPNRLFGCFIRGGEGV